VDELEARNRKNSGATGYCAAAAAAGESGEEATWTTWIERRATGGTAAHLGYGEEKKEERQDVEVPIHPMVP